MKRTPSANKYSRNQKVYQYQTLSYQETYTFKPTNIHVINVYQYQILSYHETYNFS